MLFLDCWRYYMGRAWWFYMVWYFLLGESEGIPPLVHAFPYWFSNWAEKGVFLPLLLATSNTTLGVGHMWQCGTHVTMWDACDSVGRVCRCGARVSSWEACDSMGRMWRFVTPCDDVSWRRHGVSFSITIVSRTDLQIHILVSVCYKLLCNILIIIRYYYCYFMCNPHRQSSARHTGAVYSSFNWPCFGNVYFRACSWGLSFSGILSTVVSHRHANYFEPVLLYVVKA